MDEKFEIGRLKFSILAQNFSTACALIEDAPENIKKDLRRYAGGCEITAQELRIEFASQKPDLKKIGDAIGKMNGWYLNYEQAHSPMGKFLGSGFYFATL